MRLSILATAVALALGLAACERQAGDQRSAAPGSPSQSARTSPTPSAPPGAPSGSASSGASTEKSQSGAMTPPKSQSGPASGGASAPTPEKEKPKSGG